jgi:hypothetical protein
MDLSSFIPRLTYTPHWRVITHVTDFGTVSPTYPAHCKGPELRKVYLRLALLNYS